jgi:hypothetical protein
VSDTVVVAAFTYRYEAQIAAGFLKDAGIPVATFADDGGGSYPVGIGNAQVVVVAENVERARDVLVQAGVLQG